MIKFVSIILSVFFINSCTNTKELNPLCKQEAKAGLCKGYFEKYYFNSKSKTCEVFYWGGCSGSVPFHKIKTCQDTCEE